MAAMTMAATASLFIRPVFARAGVDDEDMWFPPTFVSVD
jgi:hypothetical protein